MAGPIFPRGRVTLVGVLNLTPDSFSDGGRFVPTRPVDGPVDVALATRTAIALVEAGADILDVGGESTRPGSRETPVEVEIARIRPVIEVLSAGVRVPISIDTRKAEVARVALRAGAAIVNDVSGLRHDPRLAQVVAEAGAGLIIGHMRGIPETMQDDPHYENPIEEITRELAASVAVAERAGVAREALAIDPGLGFGKRMADNLELLARCGEIRRALGLPLLIGPSRKGFLGKLTGDPAPKRDTGSHAACAIAIFSGADAIRVHDVAGARRTIQVAEAIRAAAHSVQKPYPRAAPSDKVARAARGVA